LIYWSDELLTELSGLISQKDRPTWPQLAAQLTERFNEPVHPEQVRGAIRRFLSKQSITTARKTNMEHVVDHVVLPGSGGLGVGPPAPTTIWSGYRFRFGAVGDTHLCSRYEDLDALHALYDLYQNEGVNVVYHTGNWVDGEARFNRPDIHTVGMDGQLAYFIKNYPRRDGIMTYFIAGDDHEGWYTQSTSIDIGQHLEDMSRRAGRNDLSYLGYMEADVPITLPDGDTFIIKVLHAGGGSSYALSHTSQKIVDSYDDRERPNILLVGHYHKAEYLPNYRGVRIIQTGTFQRQTPFMRKKRLHADIGGWIVDVNVVDQQTTRVAAEFINFTPRPWKHTLV
jgi:hypothetical protein